MKPINLGGDEEFMTVSAIHGKPIGSSYYPLRRVGNDIVVTELMLQLMRNLEFTTWVLGKTFREGSITMESFNIGMSEIEWPKWPVEL